jgi:hypothetical protein
MPAFASARMIVVSWSGVGSVLEFGVAAAELAGASGVAVARASPFSSHALTRTIAAHIASRWIDPFTSSVQPRERAGSVPQR